MPAGARNQDYQVKFNFNVEVDGITAGRFVEAGPLKWSTEAESVREGGNNAGKVNLVGPGTFDKLSLKRGYLIANTEFFQWMKDIHDPAKGKGSGLRHNFDLVVLDDSGAEVGRYSFFNAFVSNYSVDAFNAKTGEIVIESVELTYDYFTVKGSGGSGFTGSEL